MSIVRSVKSALRDALRERGIFLFTGRSLPRNVDLLSDLKRFCDPSSIRTAFDIGANVGQTTSGFLTMFPAANIHAFEPVTETWKQLNARHSKEVRVRCERFALSDRCGEGTMQLGESSLFSHLRSDDGSVPAAGGEERTPMITVDEYCRNAAIETIDFLKTDTEGHDIAVFRGAEQLFAANKIRFVYCEIGFSGTNLLNTFLGDVFDHLTKRGFIFYGIYDPRDWTNSAGLTWADALFVHRSQLGEAAL